MGNDNNFEKFLRKQKAQQEQQRRSEERKAEKLAQLEEDERFLYSLSQRLEEIKKDPIFEKNLKTSLVEEGSFARNHRKVPLEDRRTSGDLLREVAYIAKEAYKLPKGKSFFEHCWRFFARHYIFSDVSEELVGELRLLELKRIRSTSVPGSTSGAQYRPGIFKSSQG